MSRAHLLYIVTYAAKGLNAYDSFNRTATEINPQRRIQLSFTTKYSNQIERTAFFQSCLDRARHFKLIRPSLFWDRLPYLQIPNFVIKLRKVYVPYYCKHKQFENKRLPTFWKLGLCPLHIKSIIKPLQQICWLFRPSHIIAHWDSLIINYVNLSIESWSNLDTICVRFVYGNNRISSSCNFLGGEIYCT
jgi:hypothetical protein